MRDRAHPEAARLLDREGRTLLTHVGRRAGLLADAYHRLLRIAWWRFVLLLFAIYAAIAACFAALYALDSRAVSGVRPGSFADLFFFSVETFATIGYGVYAPQSLYGHCVVVVEAFVGMLAIALATGLAFSKFSLATARVLWSRRVVVTSFDGASALMLRMANARDSQIAQAQLRVILLRDEVTIEGHTVRRMHDLKLARDWSPAFALTWLAHHRIDASSPLAGETPESLAAASAEIVATLIGIDETLGQTVHSRTSYGASDVRFGMRFVDVIEHGPWGRRLNYTKLDEIESA